MVSLHKNHRRMTRFWLLIILMLVAPYMKADEVTVRGLVVDSLTQAPVPYAAIFVEGSDNGALADGDGRFTVEAPRWPARLKVTVMGYESKSANVTRYDATNFTIALRPVGIALNEVRVGRSKEHYSKRNNPAVDFVRRVMDARNMTDPRRNKYYNYDKYERITLAINDFKTTDSVTGKPLSRRFAFTQEYIDTSEISGKTILPFSVKEKLSEVHYRREPNTEKEVVSAMRRTGLDDITDQESMQAFLEDVFREIDIYQNDIPLLQNRFVSPLGRLATDFYKFYLTDTIADYSNPGDSLIELSFAPKNPAMFGFIGRMYVTKGDSTMFIKRVNVNLPPDVNVNFMDKFYLQQEFKKGPDGSRLKTKDDLTAELSIIPGASGFYTRKSTLYSHHNFEEPDHADSIFNDPRTVIVDPNAQSYGRYTWDVLRPVAIGRGERGVDDFVTRMRKVPLYYWSEKVVKVLVSGYLPTGPNSKWDFGPMNTTISFNDVEGMRLRAGGMTTANLSKRWFARGYVARGFKDHKWKYKGELEYSFIDKRYHSREFPVQSLRLTSLYDVDMLGQHYLFTNADNVFLSWKRMPDTQMTYHRMNSLEYIMEMYNNFSITATLKHDRQEATRWIPFVNGHGQPFSHYNETSLQVQLRYAPGEKFYQTKTYRYPINQDAPVFVITHTIAPKRMFGNMFGINKTEISIQKRIWFSTFGYLDGIISGGHVWSRSPYPNLLIPNANLSYTIQPESFALMNAMEFINDSYASWDLTYWLNGALFNYIPVLKKLKLREAISFRGLWGHLSHRNDPAQNPELFAFPVDAHTTRMTSRPYMEIGAGIDNVFKILRVDYVWRLTYRHMPYACDRSGLRIALHFTF